MQMGIYPHVRAFRLQHNQRHGSNDEAFKALRPQVKEETAEQVEIFKDYLGTSLREEAGHLICPGSSIRIQDLVGKRDCIKHSDAC
jgi:hypothetical protein